MKTVEANFGRWNIQCIPDDGARISVLKFAGQDLLTTIPAVFKPPDRFYGEYETRAVYGYDDCFPTVDQCNYPDGQFKCRDHGELCWQKWQVEVKENQLICSVNCQNPRVKFKRILQFDGNVLKWKFEVINESSQEIVFLHVMHPLMPLEKIQSMELPEFDYIFEENKSLENEMKIPADVINRLFAMQSGSFGMFILNGIKTGSVILNFENELSLHMTFDTKLFPSFGIWWNNNGYPDEAGIRRKECAFEPIPGTCSNLAISAKEGSYLSVDAGKTFNWEISWIVSHNSITN